MTDAALDRLWRALAPVREAVGAPTARDLMLTLFFLSVSDQLGWEEVLSLGQYGQLSRVDSLFHRDDGLYWGLKDSIPSLRVIPESASVSLLQMVDILRQTQEPATTFHSLLETFAERGDLKSGEFYTPNSVASVLTSSLLLESASSIYDPACRFGELLVSADKEQRAHNGKELSFHGTALTRSSLNIARMNLHLSGVLGRIELDSYQDRMEAGISTQTYSRIIANPPFNQPWPVNEKHFYWYAEPPKGNANFGWLQNAIRLLEPGGHAAILMPNSTLFSANPRELAIRKHLVDEGCVEGIITLPPSLFYNTRIPVCIWLLTPRSERHEILLVDASTAGRMVTRTRRVMGEPEIHKIADAVSSWRSGTPEDSKNVASVPLSEISGKGYNLTPAVHLKPAPPLPDTSNSQSLAHDLMSRLLTLRDEASRADAVADQLLRELKW